MDDRVMHSNLWLADDDHETWFADFPNIHLEPIQNIKINHKTIIKPLNYMGNTQSAGKSC